MGTGVTLNLQPSFAPGERVLVPKSWLWFMSFTSHPSFRILFPLPPLSSGGMYITDRRVLVVFPLLGLLSLELSYVFGAGNQAGKDELVKEARVGKSWLLGPHLEIITEETGRHWYSWLRSRRLRLRIFIRDPQPAYDAVTVAMGASR